MDAREESAIAPLQGLAFWRYRREAPAEDTALRFHRDERRVHFAGGNREILRQSPSRGRADQGEPRAHQLDQRALAIGPGGGTTSGGLGHVGLEMEAGPDGGGERAPFRRHPECAVSSAETRRAPGGDQLLEI